VARFYNRREDRREKAQDGLQKIVEKKLWPLKSGWSESKGELGGTQAGGWESVVVGNGNPLAGIGEETELEFSLMEVGREVGSKVEEF